VRGFKEQSIVSDKRILGNLSFVNYRTQIDFPIASNGQMKAGPFFDAANLIVDEYYLDIGLRKSAGFGLRYLTPVGPVSFDWGFKS